MLTIFNISKYQLLNMLLKDQSNFFNKNEQQSHLLQLPPHITWFHSSMCPSIMMRLHQVNKICAKKKKKRNRSVINNVSEAITNTASL